MSDVFYVYLKLPDGRTFENTKLPKDSTVQEIIDMVIDLFSFPLSDNEGNSVNYFLSLDSKQPFSNNSRVIDTGIKDGDSVFLNTVNSNSIPPTRPSPQSVPADQVRITVHVPECHVHESVDLSAKKPVGDLITDIISTYKLPTFDETAKDFITYKVKSKALGDFFHRNEKQNAEEIGIPSGDTWTFNRHFKAGSFFQVQ